MQPTDHPLIIIDPAINKGQPTIKGTRLTVEFIAEQIASGLTKTALLDAYPQLTNESITVAMLYYRDSLIQENGYPCPCCGYLVHKNPPGSFDICPICSWEDDTLIGDPLLFSGGANHLSLFQGQQNYLTFGACAERAKPHVRPPLPDQKRAEGWRPIDPERDSVNKGLKDRAYQTYLSLKTSISLSFFKDRSSVYYWSPTYWQRVMRQGQDSSQQQTSSSNEETI